MKRRAVLAGCALSVTVAGCLEADQPSTSETGRDSSETGSDPDGSSEGEDDQPPESDDDPSRDDSDGDDEQDPAGEEIEIAELDPADVDLTFYYYEEEWDLEVPDDASPALSKRIGSTEDHHDAVILAASPKPDVSLVVRDSSGDALLETDVDLALDSYALVRFEIPDSYAIELEWKSGEGVVEVDEEFVDCNASLHSILLRDDEVDSEWATTLEEC